MIEGLLIWYLAASLGSIGLMGLDKRRAIRSRARIPERVLHIWACFGGFPGTWVAMQLFRHKRRKPAFWGVTLAISVLHLALWAFVIWR